MKTEKELLEIKSQIDKSRIAVSELTGQKNAILRQFEEWGCKTIEQVEKKLKDMESDISSFDNEIALGIEELEKKYK